MDALLQDLRYGYRALLASPGFAIVTVLTLALGIGANTAIFSMIDAVLLRPLSYAEPERLVMVWEDATFAGFPRNTPAPANYADWKAQTQSFEGMAAMKWRDFNLTGDGDPEKVASYAVTADFFPLLGVRPALGRAFAEEEDRPSATKVAVIGNGLWRRRYGGAPDVVGKDVTLDGEKYAVVGVMPAGFQFLESKVDLWVPMAFEPDELTNRGGHYLTVVARLKPGVTPEQAQADVATVQSRIARDYPNDADRIGALVLPLREQLAGDVRLPLVVLLVAVGFVLLIACANVASLLLSRAVRRRREIAVRAALGATRLRMVRQLLTESVLLAAAGGVAGLLLAHWSFAFLRRLVPEPMSLSTSPGIDERVFLFTFVLALATGVGFGLAPSVMSSKADLNEALKQGGGRAGVGAGGRLRSALVVAQVGLAIVLLVGAGLMIRTLLQLRGQYSDLRAASVLTAGTTLSPAKYEEHARRAAFYDAVLSRVRAFPGVLAAGYTTAVPLEWKGGTSGFYPEGRPLEPGLSYDANHRQVTAGYLEAIGIPLRRGRHFAETDTADSLPVAIVNETMAREYWPDGDALGRRFKVGDPDSENHSVTIVGVVADVRQMGVDVPVKAEMYLPYAQTDYDTWFAPRDLVIRTAGDPTGLAAAIRGVVREVDPDQPVSDIRTMDDLLVEETSNQRVGMILLSAFAVLALLLASIGIYGLLSYFVVQRAPEIGVRLALGARPRDILVMVVRRGMALALAGTAAGLVVALALTRLISSLLFDVDAGDPATFAAVPALLIAVALFACYVPARRAARVDPNVALKYE